MQDEHEDGTPLQQKTVLELDEATCLQFGRPEVAVGEPSDVLENENVPINNSVGEIEYKLLNESYKDLEECYVAYNQYGFAAGFSIRKGKQYYFTGTKEPRIKWYFCSCAGVKTEKVTVEQNRMDTRTECGAKISFEKEKNGINGLWKAKIFVKEHNHALALPSERHYLRSSRRITKPTGDLLKTFVNSGIRPVDGISFLIEESGGPQNVSFIPKDALNYIHGLRKTKMEAGDFGGLLSYFKNKKDEDPLFDWDFELDTEGRLANLFWRDGQSRLDYDYFGDVVSFDTTYRTNKYGLKCAVFVGVNNHWKNVIFACAFLSWETTESFEWLFNTFLRSMDGKQPITIFTDQAQAIINAVDNKLPETRHRLCQWHISQNAPKHIGDLNGNLQFWSLLHKCYSKCDNEKEFEEAWNEIKTLCVKSNSWLDRLYELRYRWSTTFNNDVFNAGIKSTSRSESTNHVLNSISDLTTSLYDFIVAFEKKVLGRWRENERYEDFRCVHSQVPRANKSSPLLLHASQVYTHAIYKFFENELTSSSLSYSSVEIPLGGSQFTFEVYKKIKPEKVKIVSIDTATLEIKCLCKKFESTARFAYDMILKSQCCKEAKSIIWEYFMNANDKINELLRENALDEFPPNVRSGPPHINENLVLDPQRVRPKGGKNQRKKSYLEKKRKIKTKPDCASGKEKRKKVVPPPPEPTMQSTIWPDALLFQSFE